MDAFENIVSSLLAREGYWTTTCFPVELTKAEKVAIGRHSSPRWELDLVGYSPMKNEVLVIECKSYLDSPGVKCADLKGDTASTRYKLFKEATLRNIVFKRLVAQLLERGLCRENAFGLAAGRIATSKGRQLLQKHFAARKWLLLDEEWICKRLIAFGEERYANDVAIVVAKLLLRNPQFLVNK